MRRRSGTNGAAILITGAGLGATLMFLLDPRSGAAAEPLRAIRPYWQ
jgi:hypothetical protein